MTTPTPADAIRAAAHLTAETIEPGPYSEHDLRQMWNARSDENWDDLESHERLAFAQTQAIDADRRRAEPALPPAIAYDGGDGARIWTAGPGKTDWVVRRDAGGYWERLHVDGRWWAEPWHSDFDEASMVSSHWPTAAAAWNALQRSRALPLPAGEEK
jgi:hypothetical protein